VNPEWGRGYLNVLLRRGRNVRDRGIAGVGIVGVGVGIVGVGVGIVGADVGRGCGRGKRAADPAFCRGSAV